MNLLHFIAIILFSLPIAAGASASAAIEISAIVPGCGDGIVNFDEQCDGVDLGGNSCSLLGLPSGQLLCSPQCTYITSACTDGGGNSKKKDKDKNPPDDLEEEYPVAPPGLPNAIEPAPDTLIERIAESISPIIDALQQDFTNSVPDSEEISPFVDMGPESLNDDLSNPEAVAYNTEPSEQSLAFYILYGIIAVMIVAVIIKSV